jgi:hypothetical protein
MQKARRRQSRSLVTVRCPPVPDEVACTHQGLGYNGMSSVRDGPDKGRGTFCTGMRGPVQGWVYPQRDFVRVRCKKVTHADEVGYTHIGILLQ